MSNFQDLTMHLYHVISLISAYSDRFVHKRHWCMVTELYGPSLRMLLDDDELAPLEASQIKTMAWQIVRAVACRVISISEPK